MKKKIRVERVCIVETIYALLLYLLYSSEQEVKGTFFFTGRLLKPLFERKNVKCHYFRKKKHFLSRFLLRASLRFFSHIKWNFLKSAKIFGQDHIQFFPGLVKNRSYTLLEDGPSVFERIPDSSTQKEYKSLRKKPLNKIIKILFGSVFAKGFGQNEQCENIILTKESDLKFLNNKTTTLFNIEQAWHNSTKEKQELVLSMFNVDFSASVFSTTRKIIILTQPFSTDIYNFSEQEQIELYKELIEHYDKNDVVLKRHPRDKIDYHKYFSDIEIFESLIPMQLLSIIGVKFKKAVTVCSSSVLDFPYDIEIVEIGISCRKKLRDHYVG